MLKLESVRIVETKNNYWRFLRAFHLLDALLSGEWAHDHEAKQADVRIVRGAMSEHLGIKSNGFDPFVNDTFRHFCACKTQIVLNWFDMDRWVANQDFVSLVYDIDGFVSLVANKDDVNLFKPVLFKLFGNVKELVIHAYGYALNLERLSKYAFPKSLRKINITGRELKGDSFVDQGWQVQDVSANGYELKLVR